jgi:predicted AlkP superfamily phosphohydrolase/phosphomutase
MTGHGARIDRVIVIGLDGLEPRIVGPLLAAGELPNLARLAATGGLARVGTTAPAQTPVAWSTFATGTNPGGHGIFDFIRRDPTTYRPDLALNRYERCSPWLPPKAVNLRRGTAVWERLGAAGVGSTILRCPCTYPPQLDRGRMLAGMGVPDLRGGLGSPTFYSTTPDLAARESEAVVPLRADGGGEFSTYVVGPRCPKGGEALRFEITVRPDPEADRVAIRSSGSPCELAVPLGGWSDWLRVRFKAGALQTIRGMVRFHLVRLGPGAELELYASPVNFDPDAPMFPISSPSGYARELAGAIGTYHTTGMVEDHTGMVNGRLDEAAFLAQSEDAWREREAMMAHELARFDEGLFYVLFDTPDRVQHLFWRHREPDHPANRGRQATPEGARAIDDQYRRADAVVGHALEYADDRTLVIALSDHGFGSFRRGVHLNNWLRDQGLLALRPGADPSAFPANVDWGRTRAYALGLGGIYLNLAGREGQGVVRPDEAEGLKTSIARGLKGLADPGAGGAVAVRRVLPREELYHGPFASESPDLVVHFADGYRVSWAASMGGVAEGHFEDNVKPWSGDHIVDPALVPGILLMNRPFRGEGARLLDLAPTILDALGVADSGGSPLEGRSLLS